MNIPAPATGAFTCFCRWGARSPGSAAEWVSPTGWWRASTRAAGSPCDSSGSAPTQWRWLNLSTCTQERGHDWRDKWLILLIGWTQVIFHPNWSHRPETVKDGHDLDNWEPIEPQLLLAWQEELYGINTLTLQHFVGNFQWGILGTPWEAGLTNQLWESWYRQLQFMDY